MASKDVELKVTLENVPIGAGENELAAEIQIMLQKEYADGVKVSVIVIDKPKADADKPKKADKAA
jgi:hypothetical protein